MSRLVEATDLPSAFIRRGSELVFAEEVFIRHQELLNNLTRKYNENWKDIENNPEERKKWDMGLFLRGNSGEIRIGSKSGWYGFPENSEMPIVRSVTMKLLPEQYPKEKFIEATDPKEIKEWLDQRAEILDGC